MKNGWIAVVALVAALAFALPLAAEATELAGRGTVRAVGRGRIDVWGRGVVDYTLHGIGRLVVGHRLVNRITARGHGRRTVDGSRVIFTGFSGQVTVQGPKIACYFKGGAVKFFGKGRGRVYLKGTGKYWVNGKGPRPIPEAGKTVAMGTPPDTEAVDDADEGATADAAADVVEEEDVAKYSSYKEWLDDHPEAAAALRVHVKRYYHWLKDHPTVAALIKKGVPYSVWAKNHPAAAAALARQRIVLKRKLDLNKDGVVDRKEKHIAAKKRIDANGDGKIQPVEVKQATHRHRVWKRHADRNKDGVVDRKERAIDALKRQRRRGSP